METVTVSVTIPRSMASYMNWEKQGLSLEQRAMLLYPLIRRLVISHGRAAELLGVSKAELIELYDRMGIPYLSQSREDLDAELNEIAYLQRFHSIPSEFAHAP